MIFSKILTFLKNPKLFYLKILFFFQKKFKRKIEDNAENFFKKKKIIKYFSNGSQDEIPSVFFDLKNLYQEVTKRKPTCVLEFGVGFSSIAIAIALKENHSKGFDGHLFVIDPEKKWISNTSKKFPNELKKFVTFKYSECKLSFFRGQLVSLFDDLPNICPDFIYLDGPNPDSVNGDSRGLDFKTYNRPIISADITLYESTSPNNLFILVDGRYRNVNFLQNNLLYDYKFFQNQVFKYSTFERR